MTNYYIIKFIQNLKSLLNFEKVLQEIYIARKIYTK